MNELRGSSKRGCWRYLRKTSPDRESGRRGNAAPVDQVANAAASNVAPRSTAAASNACLEWNGPRRVTVRLVASPLCNVTSAREYRPSTSSKTHLFVLARDVTSAKDPAARTASRHGADPAADNAPRGRTIPDLPPMRSRVQNRQQNALYRSA